MLIKELIDEINLKLTSFDVPGLPMPATENELILFSQTVKETFDFEIPEEFLQLLACSNGVTFNGLTIWPTKKYWLFKESFVEANQSFHDYFNNKFIFFGNRDEELYIYNLEASKFQAIEYIGDRAWLEFDNAKELFEFMLKRALD